MRWYYDANPRGRERLWGTALVASGGRSTDIVEESGTTVYDLPDVACARTHLGNVDRLTSTTTIPYYGLLISHRGYRPNGHCKEPQGGGYATFGLILLRHRPNDSW